MSQDASEHARTRREIVRQEFKERVRYVELRPGEITLTREGLMDACAVAAANMNGDDGLQDFIELLNAQLFPEGTQASQVE